MKKVAFIGLGSMGMPMAKNLQSAGYQLHVFNRTTSKVNEMESLGAQGFTVLKEAIKDVDVIITMLSNDEALKSVCYGSEGIIENAKKDAIHISMSTVSPELIEELLKAHNKNQHFLVSAPVFGRPEAALAKKLWMVVSGDPIAKEGINNVLEAMGQGVFDFGEQVSAANLIKIAGNFMILSMVEALSESMALLEKNHISRQQFVDFITTTLFNVSIYQNYGKIIAQRNYEPAGFKLELGLKDVNLMHLASDRARVPMPIVDILLSKFMISLEKNRASLDWSAIELVTAENAGLR
ncbi:MAG: 6-phosphogluconate dehydrogenase [Ferrovum sp. 37-45-19]|jgi:3-hydroxyisobutyrate dehydrogenase-like beta-hydroxyacid dehydrogenase|nr:MAG: 6-phosphogluconate dehydrogenase [Ferrovum sp. 37-45-19]OZB32126.1 MAG: 6-phosphogluconate dehydrogenase [Ferrovum sp. 34-44-207]HQT82284.1 NAD(P)-dependent oxidoreductase [Ferrovaceae bacterium]